MIIKRVKCIPFRLHISRNFLDELRYVAHLPMPPVMHVDPLQPFREGERPRITDEDISPL